MKTVSEYRADMLTILGDATGRRYSESMLDMGLREALTAYGGYVPRVEEVRVRVTAVDGNTAVVPWMFPLPLLPRCVRRKETAEVLRCGLEARAGKLRVSFYGGFVPAVDDVLLLEVSIPHSIKGLDEAKVTTVPDDHALYLATGASGYAMRIRARSVTEVFGKRPEDREALTQQAERMIEEFAKELNRISLTTSFQQSPWPVSCFRI